MKIELVLICSARFIVNIESAKRQYKLAVDIRKANSDLLFLTSDGNCALCICVEEVRIQRWPVLKRM